MEALWERLRASSSEERLPFPLPLPPGMAGEGKEEDAADAETPPPPPPQPPLLLLPRLDLLALNGHPVILALRAYQARIELLNKVSKVKTESTLLIETPITPLNSQRRLYLLLLIIFLSDHSL